MIKNTNFKINILKKINIGPISKMKFQWIGVLIALIIECTILSIISPYFLSLNNLLNIMKNFSIIGIASIGMTILIISNGIDLSIGSVLGLGGMISAVLMERFGVNALIAILVSMVAGAFIGFFISILVIKLRVHSFIVTLGMLSIARGLTYLLASGSNIFVKSKFVIFLGQGYLGKVPFIVILMIIIVTIGSLFLGNTVLGKHIYAIGGGEKASQLSGIQVNKVRMIVFIINSMIVVFAGIVSTGILASAEMTAGRGMELDVIAAVIIGGTSFTGGKGTIVGSLIGAAIVGVLKNGFVLLGLPFEVQTVSIGLVIIIAVVLDSIRNSKKA